MDTSIQAVRVALRNFLLTKTGITVLVSTRIHYSEWYSLHSSAQQFPMITIKMDRGNSYLGLSSVLDIVISAHSNKTFFEANTVLQAVTDVADPTTEWLDTSFSLRGFSNPIEEYDTRSRVYSVRKRFRINLVGA
jgi:hypothetical protein